MMSPQPCCAIAAKIFCLGAYELNTIRFPGQRAANPPHEQGIFENNRCRPSPVCRRRAEKYNCPEWPNTTDPGKVSGGRGAGFAGFTCRYFRVNQSSATTKDVAQSIICQGSNITVRPVLANGTACNVQGLQYTMKISVIISCFNMAETIGYSLKSFFAQDYADKELVVVDGGSTDGTIDIVKSFLSRGSTHTVFLSEPDQGYYYGVNKGLKIFSGDAVGMLNADDRFSDASILSRIAKSLERADMVSGYLNYVHDHQSRRVVRKWRSRPYWKNAFKSGWMPAHPTFYVRRRTVETVGHYNTRFFYADYDWMLRAYEIHKLNADFIDHVMIEMMIGGTSTSNIFSYLKTNLEALRSRQQWLGAGLIDYAFFAKPLSKIRQFASLSQLIRGN